MRIRKEEGKENRRGEEGREGKEEGMLAWRLMDGYYLEKKELRYFIENFIIF